LGDWGWVIQKVYPDLPFYLMILGNMSIIKDVLEPVSQSFYKVRSQIPK